MTNEEKVDAKTKGAEESGGERGQDMDDESVILFLHNNLHHQCLGLEIG